MRVEANETRGGSRDFALILDRRIRADQGPKTRGREADGFELHAEPTTELSRYRFGVEGRRERARGLDIWKVEV
jgi:hypothetical protein